MKRSELRAIIREEIEYITEGKYDAILDTLEEVVREAKSFMDIGAGLKRRGIKYSFSTNMLPMYVVERPVKIAILNKSYVDGADRIVGDTAIGVM